MEIPWVDGLSIFVRADVDEVTISANREGLLSLAKQLEALAEEPSGTHIHYDETNSLEEDSIGLVIEHRD